MAGPTDFQIKTSMQKLLNLVPRFWQLVEARVLKTNQRFIATNLAESTEGPTITEHHNPALKLIIKGQEVSGCLIDGGSGVNVISKSSVIAWASKIGKPIHFGSIWPTHDQSDPWDSFESWRSWLEGTHSEFWRWYYHSMHQGQTPS